MNEKKIPLNLKECCEQDSISANLWEWSKNIKNISRVFIGIIFAVGLIALIVAVSADGEESVPFVIIISTLIIALSTYVTFKVAWLLISSLASIVENTAISAKVALYEANKSETSAVKNSSQYTKAYPTTESPENNFVVETPNGTSNPTAKNSSQYTKTYPTTESPENNFVVKLPRDTNNPAVKKNIKTDDDLILCPHCQKKNIPSRTTCWYCNEQL